MVHNFPTIWRAQTPNKTLPCSTLTDTQALSCWEGNGSRLFYRILSHGEEGHSHHWPHGHDRTIPFEDGEVQENKSLLSLFTLRFGENGRQPLQRAVNNLVIVGAVPQRPGDTALGWQVAALSHFSYALLFSSSLSDFQI